MKLFISAFIQVFLVSANTYFITESFWIGIIFACFFISWFWSGNVKKISFGTLKHRIIYSSGAMLGGISGVLLSKIIVNL